MQSLPAELLSHIFSFIISSPRHICRLSQANKRFNNCIYSDDILWNHIIKSSPFNYWWECDQVNEDNKSNKRKISEISKMVYMRDNTTKTMRWINQSQIHEINTLMLGNIGSDLFRLWLALGYYNDKPDLDEREIKEWTLNGARLTFRGESGLDHGEFKAPIPANVVLVHFYDSNSLYFALSKIRKAKDYYPTAPFIVVGDGDTERCSKELIEQLCKRAEAKAFFSISDYSHPHPHDKALFHQIYSTILRYGVNHSIKNTPLFSPFSERKNAIAKRAKKDDDNEVHSEIRCDGCKVFPIVGPRHKCTRCKRVDLCDKCFSDRATKMSRCVNHTFKRIKKMDFSVLNDSEFQ